MQRSEEEIAPRSQGAKKPRGTGQFWQLFRVWGPVAVAVGLVGFLVYVPVVGLPNIYDTLLHIRIATNLDFWNVWLPTEAFGFYRPLTFAPMLLTRWVWGYYPAWGLNLLNVGHHAVNGGLLVWLLWRLTGRRTLAFLVGLLFVLFPFSYQAVAVYGHNVHPQLVTIMLVNFHQLMSVLGVRGGWRSGWLGVGLVFVIGLLAHESYVLFGPFAVLVSLLFLCREGVEKALRQGANTPRSQEPALLIRVIRDIRVWLLSQFNIDVSAKLIPSVVFSVLGAAYIVIYQFLPISRAPQAAADTGSMLQKVLYLLQGVSYPLTWFGHVLQAIGAQPLIVMALVMTLALSVLAWRAQWQTLLLGWGWWVLASTLLVIPLPAGYLLNGPRLLYLGSIGVALVWGSILADWHESGRWRQLVAVAVLLFVVVTNVRFIAARTADYAELTQGVRTLQQAHSEAVVLVNLPQWLAPEQNIYPLGAEFVQQLGDYLFVEEWTDQNIGRAIPTAAVRVDEVLGQVAYGYDVHNQAGWDVISAEWTPKPSDVYITHYTEEGTSFDYVGGFMPEKNNVVLAEFDSYTLHSAEAYVCDGDVQLTSLWSYAADRPPPSTVSTFAQLLGADGVLVSQNDRAPLGLPTYKVALSEGWHLLDFRTLARSAENLPNALAGQVLLGVYDFTTGEREAAFSAENTPLQDNAVRIPITTCR